MNHGVSFGYYVIEHYDDEPSEPFGYYVGSPDIKTGDIIQLKWLDGSGAHMVKVTSRDEMTLHVMEV